MNNIILITFRRAFMRIHSHLIIAVAALGFGAKLFAATDLIDSSWQHAAPREDIAPAFLFDGKGGRDGSASLVIQADEREGLSGQWFKTVPVKGGQHYRFSVARKCDGIFAQRRETSVRILWQDDAGNQVAEDGPTVTSVLKGWKANAEPEYPSDRETDTQGWTEVSGVYRAPGAATQALIELHLQWVPRATVRWSNVMFEPCEKPAARTVRLAAVHYRPLGKSMEENRRVRSADCRRGETARGSRRAARDTDLLWLAQDLRRLRRAGAWTFDELFWRARERAQSVHRRRTDRARGTSYLQCRGTPRT